MKTHPFVIGVLITLFVDTIRHKNPQSAWEVIVYSAIFLTSASLIALLEWWSRQDPDKNQKSGHDL